MSDINNEFEEFDDEELETLILTDENGEDVEFEFLGNINYQDRNFALLIPTDEDDDGVVILEVIINDDDEETVDFVGIEDDELLDKLFNKFKEENEDLFDFE